MIKARYTGKTVRQGHPFTGVAMDKKTRQQKIRQSEYNPNKAFPDHPGGENHNKGRTT